MVELELAVVPFALLAAALPGAIQLGQTILNKPKRSDYKANTSGMERYRAYLRGKTASSEVAHQALQPQLKAIGAQTRQTERKIQSAVGRGDLSASEEAQLQISQGQAASSVAQQAGEQAFEAQRQENRRVGQQVAQIESNITQAKEQAKLEYERATSQYHRDIAGSALNIAGSVASAGISQHMTKLATSKSAFDAATAAGVGDFESAADLAKASVDAGFADPRQYVNMLGNQQKIKQAFGQYGAEELAGASQELFGTAEFDIGKDLSTGGAQQLLNKLGEGRTNLAMETSQAITANQITDISQIKDLNLSDPVKMELSNQLAQQKAGLADPIDKAIGNAIQSGDKAGLIKVMGTPNISEKDYKTALNAHTKIVDAEIKQTDTLRKERAERIKISSGDQGKMDAFAATAGTLKSRLEAYSATIGGEKSQFLSQVEAIREGVGISNEQQDTLNTSARAFVKSMNIGKKVNGVLVEAPLDVLDMFKDAKIDVNAKSEVSIITGFESLIGQLRKNSVELTPEQLKIYYSVD